MVNMAESCLSYVVATFSVQEFNYFVLRQQATLIWLGNSSLKPHELSFSSGVNSKKEQKTC